MNRLLQVHLVSLSYQYRLDIVGMTYLKRSGRKVEIFAEMLGEALISKIEIISFEVGQSNYVAHPHYYPIQRDYEHLH
jgi:hypothetical protein